MSKGTTKLKESGTIFLLGAGASKPAGIPTIDEMTKNFLNDPFNAISRSFSDQEIQSLNRDLQIIKKMTESYFGKLDLEYLMTMAIQLQDDKFRKMAESMEPSIASIGGSSLLAFKNILSDRIRREIERVPEINYLWGLRGFIKEDECLNVFTLNYDATIEVFCERNNITCTDGFSPDWNPKNFDHSTINLFKLHGSLYWFKSEFGKIIRVPLKGISASSVRYLGDEAVSEMMIYPALQKSKESEVYSWLSQKFIQSLNSASTCVVVGYSFRDIEILNLIQDAMYRNPNLWLVISSPRASSKREMWPNHDEIISRILMFDMDARKAISERHLQSNLRLLEEARNLEKEVWRKQALERKRLDSDWIPVLRKFRRLEHYHRLISITEKLLTYDFSVIPEGINSSINWEIGDLFLYKLLDDNHSSSRLDNRWKQLFLEYSTLLEYATFFQVSPLRSHNPIKPEELPKWGRYVGEQSDYSLDTRIEEMKKLASDMHDKISKQPLKDGISKLIESLDMISLDPYIVLTEEDEYGPDFVVDTNHNLDEIIQKYDNNDLGVRKWVQEIIESS